MQQRIKPHLLLLVLLLSGLGVSHAAEPTSCGMAGPSVFNVFDGGKIGITNQQGYVNESDTCKVTFSGSNDLNVTIDGYYSPSQNGDGVTGVCAAEPSGTTLDKLTLPNFPTDTRDIDVNITNQGVWIAVAGTTYQKFTNITFRWCQNPSNDNNKCFNNQNGMKDYTKADGVTFSTATNSNFVFSNSVQNVYDDISTDNGQIYFKYDGTKPYVINHLTATNQSVITFEPGSYFIREADLADVTVVNVAGTGDGSGKVRLYIKDGTNSKLIGNQSCVNMNGVTTISECSSKGAPTADVLSAQHPEKLGFYFYEGNVLFGDTAFVSASVYVHNGDLTFTGNGKTAFAGEVLAANIHIGNMPSYLHYKDTGVFDELYTEASGTINSVHEGYYQLAPAAHPKRATTGELVFIPYQTDYLVKNGVTQKRGGHVQAFAYKTNGATETTATWDAAAMTKANRDALLYVTTVTNANNLGIATFASLDATADSTFNVTDNTLSQAVEDNVLQGPAVTSTTSAQWGTIIGQPNTTKPLIYKNEVLFSTSDGFVYAVNRTTGALNWGWMPKEFLYGLANYKTFIEGDPMQGQLVGIASSELLEDPNSTDKSGTILGTAKGGALHYALSLDTAGKISDVLWMDARKSSDTGTSGSAAVYDDLTGSSPNAAEQVVYKDSVTYMTLYIVNNRIITRNVDGSSPKSIDPGTGITLTSTPLVALTDRKDTKNVLYVGDSKGDVYTLDLSANNASMTKLANFGEVAPITYLTYTRMGDYEYLTAQSTARLTVFKRQISDATSPATNAWAQAWTTVDSGTQVAAVDKMQTIPTTATFSARVSVAGGVISAPVSDYDATTCLATAWSYFFNLENGYFPMEKIKYLGTTLVVNNKQLGTGVATESTIQAFNGKLSFQSQGEQNLPPAGSTTPLPGTDDRFELTGNTLIERRGWREIYEE